MAKGDLYAAHVSAGKAGGAYKASLYDIADVGSKIDFLKKETALEMEHTEEMLGTISSGVELSSTLYGGWKSKEEFKEAKGAVQERMASRDYQKYLSELPEDEKKTSWERLGKQRETTETQKTKSRITEEEKIKKEWLKKYKPAEKERGFIRGLFGAPEEYTFGEGGTFKRSDIIAASKLGAQTDLERLLGLASTPGADTMYDEATHMTGVTGPGRRRKFDPRRPFGQGS